MSVPATHTVGGLGSERRHRVFALVVAFVLALTSLAILADPASAKKTDRPGQVDPPGQLVQLQLLAFNDYHGHLEPEHAGTADGVDAGGGEYLSAKLNELRQATSTA